MTHDFKRFPELTNEQLQFYYFESPHRQILEDFDCRCTKVHDGDTILVKWSERDFEFPIRFSNIAAAELNEPGGKASQSWLEDKLLNRDITVKVDHRNRVEKWGRLLGTILMNGSDVGDESVQAGMATIWRDRNSGKIPSVKWAIPESS
jgi:endonuclease YncB( thermonuclease family)